MKQKNMSKRRRNQKVLFFFIQIKQPLVEFTEPIKPSREKSGSSHSSSSSYSKTLTRSITRRKKVRVNILDADAFNADLASSPKGDGGFFLKI